MGYMIEVHTNPTHSRFVAVMSSDHGEIRSAVRETREAATAEVREECGKRRMIAAYVARLDKQDSRFVGLRVDKFHTA